MAEIIIYSSKLGAHHVLHQRLENHIAENELPPKEIRLAYSEQDLRTYIKQSPNLAMVVIIKGGKINTPYGESARAEEARVIEELIASDVPFDIVDRQILSQAVLGIL